MSKNPLSPSKEDTLLRIHQLVQAFKMSASSFDFVLVVAGEPQQVRLCKILLLHYQQKKNILVKQKIDLICRKNNVDTITFYAALEQLLHLLNTPTSPADTPPSKRDYQCLGLPINANAQEIKKAYWRLSLRYHPDHAPHTQDHKKKFIAINRAYQTLLQWEKQISQHTSRRPNSNWRVSRLPATTIIRKKIIVIFISLVALLAGLSLWIQQHYQEQAYRTQRPATHPLTQPKAVMPSLPSTP